MQEDESLLINLSQKGDVNAFNQLVLKYQQTTYNVVLRMLGDRDTAADVTQDTFIAALRRVTERAGRDRPGSKSRGVSTESRTTRAASERYPGITPRSTSRDYFM